MIARDLLQTASRHAAPLVADEESVGVVHLFKSIDDDDDDGPSALTRSLPPGNAALCHQVGSL